MSFDKCIKCVNTVTLKAPSSLLRLHSSLYSSPAPDNSDLFCHYVVFFFLGFHIKGITDYVTFFKSAFWPFACF